MGTLRGLSELLYRFCLHICIKITLIFNQSHKTQALNGNINTQLNLLVKK